MPNLTWLVRKPTKEERVGVHVFAGIIVVAAVVVGIIVAASSSITTGIIIAAAGFGIGTILALLNFVRLWRRPDKMLPKNWP